LLEPSNLERDDGQYIVKEVTDQVPTAQEARVPKNYTYHKFFITLALFIIIIIIIFITGNIKYY
jgi:hypothetical protein